MGIGRGGKVWVYYGVVAGKLIKDREDNDSNSKI